MSEDRLGPAHPAQRPYKLAEVRASQPVPVRAQVLDEAKQAVCSDRNTEYGEPIDNFSRWAGMCNAAGYRGPGGRDLKPHDLAIIQGLGKFSRAMETPDKRDHGVDVAGYGSLMTELALTED